jgi:hypothetical protein
MPFLRVEIVEFVDEYQPGLVRCAFRDADGQQHSFVEKIPRVTDQDLWRESQYPQVGAVECDSVEWLSGAESPSRFASVTLAIAGAVDSPGDPQSFVVQESQLANREW